MAKEQIIQTAQGLPAWAKGVIAVAAVGGVIFVGYKVYQVLTDLIEGKDQRDVVKSVRQEIKDELNQGKTPTHPTSVYRSAVNQIKTILDDCEYYVAPEVDVIKIITRVVKNNLDWKILQSEWGTKDVEDCVSWTSTKYELAELLQDQLDDSFPPTTPASFAQVGSKIIGEGFVYDGFKSGQKKTIDILKIYFDKIGVKF